MCAPFWLAARFCLCNATHPPTLSHLFSFPPSGRLNGRYAETTPLYLHIPLHSALAENCTRQKTKVGRGKPMWNNGRVKYNLMVITPTLSPLTAFIWLYFKLCVTAAIKTHTCISRHFVYIRILNTRMFISCILQSGCICSMFTPHRLHFICSYFLIA